MKITLVAVVGLLLGMVPVSVTESSAGQLFAVSGVVRDTTGVVPGATVVLSSAGKQLSTTTTDQVGTYRFSDLAAGSYELSFVMRGFETAVRTVTLRSGSASVDVLLAVGRVSTTLTVTQSAGKATASRLPVADDEVPAQVSSIPQELIRQQGTNTVADALKNASGVQAFKWYGVYEQYTIRGFNDPNRDDNNVVLVDGMRMGGNRYGTQTNNVQSIEVLKGPSSVLYGRGAVGGSINIVRKKPETFRAYDFSYRVGRFNTHQVAGGATGPVANSTKFFYRLDASYEKSNGWRDAGADRFNASPSLTWNMSDRAHLSIHQNFNRDRFDGDGGVPLNITDLPNFRPDLRFNLPQDNVLVEDSQTQILFTGSWSSRWQFRNSVLVQRSSDRYFVTEGLYGDPENNQVFREPLDFHHSRRPVQNQSEVIGSFDSARWGRHNLLFGYDYQKEKYRTDVTAGDDPDCLCGYWWLTVAPMDITTLQETQSPLDAETIARQTFVDDHIHGFYWQDQIDILPQLKVNIGGRWDDYQRSVERIGGLPFTPQARAQTAFTYRAGLVYAPRDDQQLYFSTATAFSPVTTVPPDGSALEPATARNIEAGHRWQGWNGRVDTSVAVYHIVRNHLNVRQSATRYLQVGEQTSRGVDVDINADLGGRTHLILNYGATRARFNDAEALTGLTPPFVPVHNVNAWLRQDWGSGFNSSIGVRYLSEQFATNTNSVQLAGYGIVSGSIGYRAGRWDWSLNADNVMNKQRYFLPGHFSNQVFPGQPINVTSTIRVMLD